MFGLFKKTRKIEELLQQQNDILSQLVLAVQCGDAKGGELSPNAETISALEASRNGAVSRATSVDDLFADGDNGKPAQKVAPKRKKLNRNDAVVPANVAKAGAIRFNERNHYVSHKFTSGSKRAACERLIKAIEKRGGTSLVAFEGFDFTAGYKEPFKAMRSMYGTAPVMDKVVSGHVPVGNYANNVLIVRVTDK